MDTAIVYYSRNGSARLAAEAIGASTQGSVSLVELGEKRAWRGALGFVRSGFMASRGIAERPEGDPWGEIADARTVYLVSPVWAGTFVPIIRGFVLNANLGGRTVHTVTVQADSRHNGIEKSHALLREIVAADAPHSPVTGNGSAPRPTASCQSK